MEILQAIVNHYQEIRPHLQTRDNMLFFVKEGVIILLEDNYVVILSSCTRPDILDRLFKAGLANLPKTTLDKMNQRRAWKELVKISRCRYLEYCDPCLFDVIDEALDVPPIPAQ